MSRGVEIASRVLENIAEGRTVENIDAMYLRFIAAPEELTLPIEEIARYILARENEPPTKSRAAAPK